jgi:hypothetical protein
MKKLTITKSQYEKIKEFTSNNCLAKAYELTCKLLFNKYPNEIKHFYNSIEYNTSAKIANAVCFNYKYLKVIEE